MGENWGVGDEVVLLSDLDIQLFPGWAELVRGCIAAVPFCMSQQPGYYSKRTRPLNGGFFAIRAGLPSLKLLLDLVGEFEKTWVSAGDHHVGIRQEIVGQYFFERVAPTRFAFFNPEIVMSTQWSNINLKIKAYHVADSVFGSKYRKLAEMRLW